MLPTPSVFVELIIISSSRLRSLQPRSPLDNGSMIPWLLKELRQHVP
jgi:hypothetical protein